MKIARPCQALPAISSPQLGPTSWVSILSVLTPSSLARFSWTGTASLVPSSLIWIRKPPRPSSWTTAVWPPDAFSATSLAWETDTLLLGVLKTAPPENSMPMLRPRTAWPAMLFIGGGLLGAGMLNDISLALFVGLAAGELDAHVEAAHRQ